MPSTLLINNTPLTTTTDVDQRRPSSIPRHQPADITTASHNLRQFPITKTTNDFLPHSSFDDSHGTSFTATTPLRAKQHTPVPDDFRNMTRTKLSSSQNLNLNDDSRARMGNDPTRPPLTRPPPGSRPTRSASIINRQSSIRQSSLSSNASTLSNANSSIAAPIRSQRSLQPPSSQSASVPPLSNTTKATRRSMLYTGDSDSSASASTASRPKKLVNNGPLPHTGSAVQPPRASAASLPASALEGARLASTRAAKASSLMPPSKPSPPLNHASSSKFEHSRSASFAARSPNKIAGLKLPPTPSAASRRMSTLPGMPPSASHATGLGARTISPTDTRRAKRMSMVHGPPPIPYTPPLDSMPYDRSKLRNTSKSPSMLPRTTPTPASSRATPEPKRKSLGHGQSPASTANHNTVRTSNFSMQPRHPAAIPSSRLPTAKPHIRNVHSSAGHDTDEHVPPVPAIPKAYESPKDSPADTPFFTRRKSSLPIDLPNVEGITLAGSSVSTAHRFEGTESKPKWASTAEIGQRQRVRTPTSSKNLQPLRLPPINLLPLSTPMSRKVAALKPDHMPDVESTTPPSRRSNMPPTTPMTASKAIPSSRHRSDVPNDHNLATLRSVSSVNHLTNASLPPATIRHVSGAGQAAMPTTSISMRQVSHTSNRRSTSPFVSSSLPKSASEYTMPPVPASVDTPPPFGKQQCRTSTGDSDNPHATRISDSTILEKHSLPSIPSSSSSTSLRRKLSMGWKRSTSKSSISLSDIPPPPPKHGDVQSSRLPSSSTVSSISSNTSTSDPAVLSKFKSHTDVKRGYESASTTLTSDMQRARGSLELSESQRIDQSNAGIDRTKMGHKTSSSVLSSAHKLLHNKSSSSTIKSSTIDPYCIDLDRDDMAAEDEMKKLASRRRETEAAARQLDSLRRRAVPREAVSPQYALSSGVLNLYEKGEVVDYKDVYFTGTLNAQKHVGDMASDATNFGYDDERGDYSIIPGDHLSYRYEIVNILGKGSFGQVVRCVDHKTGGLVAIKIIRNKKRFHQQALVEVNILKKLREWDPHNKHSMVSFTQSFYFRGHLCISTELLDMNLYEFIKANNFKGCSCKLIRRFTKQMLGSLILLKQKKVIHCDLKPENILLTHPMHSEIKVIDFGSSCFENEKVYTYIQSRFYRSPEVILGMTYGLSIDMWSLGCILAELYTGYPIFPGENEQEQLACIMEVFGPPEKHLIEKSTRKKLFFDSQGKPRLTVSSKGRRRKPSSKTLSQVLKCEDEAFLDFLSRCLRWDPDRRLRPEDALRHEFITKVKSPTVARPVPPRASSPLKRFNTIAVPSATHHARPLPEPPTTSFKNGVAVRQASNGSPTKPLPRRQSHMTNMAPANGSSSSLTKSTGGTLLNGSTGSSSGNSALPRVAHRVQSGSMAGAGASAAFRRA